MYLRRIRDLREDHDLKQRELAKLLQCSQQAYARYEAGIREIPLESLVTLANYYQVSTDYLLERTNDPTFNPSI